MVMVGRVVGGGSAGKLFKKSLPQSTKLGSFKILPPFPPKRERARKEQARQKLQVFLSPNLGSDIPPLLCRPSARSRSPGPAHSRAKEVPREHEVSRGLGRILEAVYLGSPWESGRVRERGDIGWAGASDTPRFTDQEHSFPARSAAHHLT